MNISIKRVYEDPAKDDGYRILVDRLWPRGISKDKAHIEEWLKEIGPSNELRKWFGHEPPKFPEFRKRYATELKTQAVLLDHIRSMAKKQHVCLVYSAHDEEHNQAVVLREVLMNKH